MSKAGCENEIRRHFQDLVHHTEAVVVGKSNLKLIQVIPQKDVDLGWFRSVAMN
jgi:hypothetical protein